MIDPVAMFMWVIAGAVSSIVEVKLKPNPHVFTLESYLCLNPDLHFLTAGKEVSESQRFVYVRVAQQQVMQEVDLFSQQRTGCSRKLRSLWPPGTLWLSGMGAGGVECQGPKLRTTCCDLPCTPVYPTSVRTHSAPWPHLPVCGLHKLVKNPLSEKLMKTGSRGGGFVVRCHHHMKWRLLCKTREKMCCRSASTVICTAVVVVAAVVFKRFLHSWWTFLTI